MKTEGQHPAQPTGNQRNIQPEFGLTKREYFAAMAMQGMIANSNNQAMTTRDMQGCVDLADALITALNQKNEVRL